MSISGSIFKDDLLSCPLIFKTESNVSAYNKNLVFMSYFAIIDKFLTGFKNQ